MGLYRRRRYLLYPSRSLLVLSDRSSRCYPCAPGFVIGIARTPAVCSISHWALLGVCLLPFNSVRRSSPLPNSVVMLARPPNVRVVSSVWQFMRRPESTLAVAVIIRSLCASSRRSRHPQLARLDPLDTLLAAFPSCTLRLVRWLFRLTWVTFVVSRRVCKVLRGSR